MITLISRFKKIMWIAFLFMFVLASKTTFAQNNNPRKAEIEIISRTSSASVVLRWAPTKAGAWVIANQIGYVIDRAVLDPNKAITPEDYVRLNSNVVKPLDLEVWKQSTNENNMFSAIAAQALYGKLFNPTPLNSGQFNVLKNAADELSNRYSFSLFAADNDAFTAQALGLRFVDDDVELGAKYVYRIYLAEHTDQYSIDTSYLVVDVKEKEALLSPVGLSFESGDGQIKLQWDEKEVLGYSGYNVYRSDDEGKTFVKLNSMPIISITPTNAVTQVQPSYMDTAIHNYKKYVYQVKGVDAFAELSNAAEITAFSKDLEAPLAPVVNKPEQISNEEIKLTWTLNEIPDDLLGFIVSRSQNSTDHYRLITIDPLSKNTFSFTDDMGGEYEMYYTVAAVDTAGNMRFSLPVLASRIDNIAPKMPVGLKGMVSDKGIVTLRWEKGKERNLKGYRVLRANDPTHDFIQVTGYVHEDTVFVDSISLRSLTKSVYYKIAAVNKRYQHSELTEILEIKRPDVVPPVAAVFSDVFVTDSSVSLKWYPSTSEDAKHQLLYRKLKTENEWTIKDTLINSIAEYMDLDVEMKKYYQYTIVTIDESDLKSEPTFPVQARPYDTGKRKAVENLIADLDISNKTVNLSWTYVTSSKERVWYVVYKAKNGGEFKEYKALKSSEYQFIDGSLSQGITEYGVVVMTSHGGESEMTKVSVEIGELN